LLMHELVSDPIQQHVTTCKGHENDMHKEWLEKLCNYQKQ
jgi:hypothetical protein